MDLPLSASQFSRRDALKALGSASVGAAVATGVADAQAPAEQRGAGAGRGGGRQNAAFNGRVTPSPTARQGGKPLLTLYSLSLQWAGYDEAADTAAKSGWPAIGWTARGGGHVLPENVVRDLPRAVAAARKAGLTVPIIVTPLRDAQTPYVEQYLDTMSKLGLRYYQAPPLGQYDYSKDLQPQIDLWKPRIEALAKLNEKYGTTAVYHVEGGAGNIGGGGWDLWLTIKDFDPKYIGMDVDLGHATMKGGPEVWELLRFSHGHMLGVASKDIRWAKKTDPTQGPRRSDPSADYPWTAEYVVPGTGLVNFKAAFEYIKLIGFAESFLHYSEYFVNVPGRPEPVSLLRPMVPSVVPKDLYIASLRRDYDYFVRVMAEAGL
jgi:sugar phosphate isomerase/epimerase